MAEDDSHPRTKFFIALIEDPRYNTINRGLSVETTIRACSRKKSKYPIL
jgi:hypothetical protein